MSDKIDITPDTKVGHLIEAYPELKSCLIKFLPAFKNLSNPILFKTAAKVTSLKQAAQVGNISLPELIIKLRKEAGLNSIDLADDNTSSSLSEIPEWFDPDKIVKTLDARPFIEKGEHPIGIVISSINKLPNDKIFELITPFIPAPVIDKVKSHDLSIYVNDEDSAIVKTYFYKSPK